MTDIKLKNNFDLYYKNLKTGKDTNISFDKILVAVGIEGNINNLGLENTAIKIKNNQIITYEYGKTDEKNFFAIGDVAGPWLAHKASHEGVNCVEYIAGISNSKLESKMVIPSVYIVILKSLQ